MQYITANEWGLFEIISYWDVFEPAPVFIATYGLILQSHQVKIKLRPKLRTFYFLQAFQIVHRWHYSRDVKICLFTTIWKITHNVLKWMIKKKCDLLDNIIHDIQLSLFKGKCIISFIQFLHQPPCLIETAQWQMFLIVIVFVRPSWPFYYTWAESLRISWKS